jgi:hypothetical protein
MFDYFKLIDSTIKERPFYNGVHKGLITSLVKTSEKKHIGNWHPIILLNVSYKMFTKVLRLRLQPILMEIIDVDQNIQLDLFYTIWL